MLLSISQNQFKVIWHMLISLDLWLLKELTLLFFQLDLKKSQTISETNEIFKELNECIAEAAKIGS